MIVLLLLLLTGALIAGFIQKYILRIKEPEIEGLWQELEEQDWYKELKAQPDIHEFLQTSKREGLLNDPYYVRKIMDNEGHRIGFINYVKEKTAE
ncbi:hypothetical protein V1502_09500 [Bacillus sp. SCS-153A]|uniref:hypothetical protein n=1 Tax=Rossellomorea sedimentorum TaxID=3115294 RepID=UPI0039069F14